LISAVITRISRNPEILKTSTTEKNSIVKKQEGKVNASKEIWMEIKADYDISKKAFGLKIDFVEDTFKRKIIFRDIEHAYFLSKNGFSKPAVILAGGIIEELLRLFLKSKKIKPSKKTFEGYVETCKNEGLLKSGIHKLSDSFRHFRNLVHLEVEKSKNHSISKATGKGAVASIFTIANDF